MSIKLYRYAKMGMKTIITRFGYILSGWPGRIIFSLGCSVSLSSSRKHSTKCILNCVSISMVAMIVPISYSTCVLWHETVHPLHPIYDHDKACQTTRLYKTERNEQDNNEEKTLTGSEILIKPSFWLIVFNISMEITGWKRSPSMQKRIHCNENKIWW